MKQTKFHSDPQKKQPFKWKSIRLHEVCFDVITFLIACGIRGCHCNADTFPTLGSCHNVSEEHTAFTYRSTLKIQTAPSSATFLTSTTWCSDIIHDITDSKLCVLWMHSRSCVLQKSRIRQIQSYTIASPHLCKCCLLTAGKTHTCCSLRLWKSGVWTKSVTFCWLCIWVYLSQ